MANEVAKLKKEAEVLKQENLRFVEFFICMVLCSFLVKALLSDFFIGLLRCPLQEKEVDYLEKDVDMKDLKEQVASLSDLLRQLQVQKAALIHNDKSQVSVFGCCVLLFLYAGAGNYI